MPSYKTHSIHGERTMYEADLYVDVDKEAFKTFCMGPDLLMTAPTKSFDLQHRTYVREYFEYLLAVIKRNKLYNNPEVMAFLYGQLDHYILDLTMHPYIFYYTDGLPKETIVPGHGLVEMWLDDYVSKKYKTKGFYYSKLGIRTKTLKELINKVYYKIFGEREANNISLGMFEMTFFDSVIRNNAIGIVPLVTKVLNVGDIVYHKDSKLANPFLNLEHETWYHPETGEARSESFDDLWYRAIDNALETFSDVNNYLFHDKALHNRFISNNISYDTGVDCDLEQKLYYTKKYK